MEKLNNMTCGECKYHKNMRCHLPQRSFIIVPEEDACRHFEQKPKMTNGDKIRAMSDEELTEKFIYTRREQNGDKYYLSTITVGKWSSRTEAKAATIEELKKEVKDEQ